MSLMQGSLAEQFKQATGRTGRWPYVVKVFDLHHNAHIEEFLALIDALRDNEKQISGSRSAAVEFSNAGMFTPDGRPVQEWEAEGHFPIGTWGSYFDEHRLSRALQEERVSAAMIMSDFTGSYQDEAWRPIINYVSDNDSRGNAKTWDLAALVLKMHDYLAFEARMAYRKNKTDITEAQRFQNVFRFVSTIIEAQYAKNCGDLNRTPETTDFWDDPAEYVAIWLIIRFGNRCGFDRYQQDILLARYWTPQRQPRNRPRNPDGSLINIATYVADSLKLTGRILNRVGTVKALAQRDNDSSAVGSWDLVTLIRDTERYLRFKGGKFVQREYRAQYLGDMVTLALDAEYRSQCEFVDACDDIEAAIERNTAAAKPTKVDRHLPSVQSVSVKSIDDRRRYLAILRMNNPQAHKAARKIMEPRPAVILIKNSKGNVTIFGTTGLDLDPVHQELLDLEAKTGRTDVSPERIWMHFQRSNANNIMNGGRSAPGVPATRIPLRIIVRLVTTAMQTINQPTKSKRMSTKNIIAELAKVVQESTMSAV